MGVPYTAVGYRGLGTRLINNSKSAYTTDIHVIAIQQGLWKQISIDKHMCAHARPLAPSIGTAVGLPPFLELLPPWKSGQGSLVSVYCVMTTYHNNTTCS